MKRLARPFPRQKPGSMNKTESAYAERLEMLRRLGDVGHFEFEPITLKLAKNTRYTPDFMVVTDGRIEFHEVKGFWRDDARVKIKVAAEKFWQFKFLAVKKVKGGWDIEEF